MGLAMNDSPDKEISTDLTLSDLKIINNLIDVVATKGIIRPSDYTVIGNIYEKINIILNEKKS